MRSSSTCRSAQTLGSGAGFIFAYEILEPAEQHIAPLVAGRTTTTRGAGDGVPYTGTKAAGAWDHRRISRAVRIKRNRIASVRRQVAQTGLFASHEADVKGSWRRGRSDGNRGVIRRKVYAKWEGTINTSASSSRCDEQRHRG